MQRVELEHDGCHVTSTAMLGFVFDGDGGQCAEDTDCRLFDPRCCACEPVSPDEALALGPGEAGASCDAICGPCPQIPPAPLNAVARCIGGQCEAVDIREQDYTQCISDLDCTLVPTTCCGWRGPIHIGNAYAINREREMQFYACGPDVDCPPVDCGRGEQLVVPICGDNGHCELQNQ